MSKNLRGYSGSQIQINLDDIQSNSITSTNGTFTNLSIGTYTITTLNISDLIATGVIKFSGLTQQNPLNTDTHNIIIHDPTTNRLYKFNTLNFSPINNQLSIHNLLSSGEIYYKNQTLDQRFEPLGGGGGSFVTIDTTQTITGTKSFSATTTTFNKIDTSSDVTIGGDMEVYTAITLRDTANNAKTFKLSTAGSTTAPFIRMKNFLNTGDYQVGLLTDETRLYGETCIDFEVDDNSGLKTSYLKVENSNVTCNTNLSVTGNITKSGDAVKTQVENDLLYCKLSGTQTISGIKTFSDSAVFSSNLSVTGNITKSGDAVKTQVENDLLYCKLTGAQSISGIKTFSDSAVFSSNLTVTGRTNLGTNVSINGLNSVITNTTYPLLTWNNTSSVSRTIRVDIPNLYYDTTDNTLYAPNFSGNFNVTALTRSDNTDYPVLFYDTSTTDICIDSVSNHFTYNPSENKLDVRNINVVVDLTTEKVTLDTGKIFNHSTNEYMGLKAISNNGTNLSGLDYNLALWKDGSIRMIARNNQRFYIYNSTTGTTNQRLIITDSSVNVNTNLSVDNDATITGDTTITAVNSTVSNNNRIPFIEGGGATGRLCESNLYYNPSDQTLVSANITTTNAINSPTLTVTGTNNGQIIIDPTYGLSFNQSDGYLFRMAGVWKMRIDNTLTTIYDNFQLNGSATIDGDIYKQTATLSAVDRDQNVLFHDNEGDKRIKENNSFYFNPSDERLTVTNLTCGTNVKLSCSVPTASTKFPVLLLNEGSNDVKKANSFMSYNPSLDRIYGKDIMLNEDSGTRGRLTLIEPIRYGGPVLYTPLNYTYIIGNTDTIATIDAVGSGLNSGKFGNGVYIGINRSGVKATAFGSNTDLISWNQYINATNTPTSFTNVSLFTGTWEVTVMCDYMSSNSSSSASGGNRVNPILRLEVNGTEIEEGTQSLYIRHQLGRVGTMRTNYILKLEQGDVIALRTYVNYGGTTNFSSLMLSGQYSLSNFNFRATFLGTLDEYDRTPA